MIEIYQKAVRFLKEGRRLVLATIIIQQGPSPRGVGTKCLVLDDGSLVGTIGGGPIEARTLEEAQGILSSGRPLRLPFSLTGTDVAETDMLCGGEVELFLEPITHETPNSTAVFKKAADFLRRGGAGLLAVIVDGKALSGGAPGRAFISSTGETVGSLSEDEGLNSALKERADRILDSGRPGIIPLKDFSGRAVEVFVEPISSAPVLYVFGGGHVSKQIVPLAARVGFDIIVIDDRAEFADRSHFPDAAEVRNSRFEGVFENMAVDDSSYLVIVTRGHMNDKIVLEQALRTNARYIGMIGSRKKRSIIYEKLLEEGFTNDDLSRVHSPIGLEIGADTPEEIAVSIVAELIKVRAGV